MVSFLFTYLLLHFLPIGITANSLAPKTLYEKIALSPLIIHGIVLSDAARYAEVLVQDVLKGDYKSDRLQISFRRENYERERGQKKIVFKEGEEAIFLLEPVLDHYRKTKDKRLFRLFSGAEGKIELSPESGRMLIKAIKRFVEIQSLKNINKIWKEHKRLLHEKNRFLIEAGFQEILKFRTADWAMMPVLLQFFSGADVPFRIYSARLIGQILQKEKEGEGKDLRGEAMRVLVQHARGDEDPRVRVEAIRALSVAGAEDHQDVLEAISRHDASQDVRYEAQKALYEIKRAKKSQ